MQDFRVIHILLWNPGTAFSRDTICSILVPSLFKIIMWCMMIQKLLKPGMNSYRSRVIVSLSYDTILISEFVPFLSKLKQIEKILKTRILCIVPYLYPYLLGINNTALNLNTKPVYFRTVTWIPAQFSAAWCSAVNKLSVSVCFSQWQNKFFYKKSW